MFPIVAEIVGVAEFHVARQPLAQLGKRRIAGRVLFAERKVRVEFAVEDAVADPEVVQVVVLPAHRGLDDQMQIAQVDLRWNLDSTPHQARHFI